jgi:hypothetical protein
MEFGILDDVIIFKNLDLKNPAVFSEKISKNTANTWQSNKDDKEKLKDTQQGKVAEGIVSDYLVEVLKIKYLSYDSFRSNNFEKHAPFDGLIITEKTSKEDIKEGINKINAEISKNRFGIISGKTRLHLEKKGIYTVEIKSTKVAQRHKRLGNSDKMTIDQIKNDDFLTYPKFLRKSSSVNNINDYMSYLKERKIIPNVTQGNDLEIIKGIELSYMNYFFIRIYLDYDENKAYLIGFITKSDFFVKMPTIKKMIKFGKSEEAIYFSLPLSSSRAIDNIGSLIK